MGQYEEIMKRTRWFREARFGLFLHWGLYSVRAEHEWVKSRKEMTDAEYQQYFETFTAENYCPKEWARIAKDAGMKYAVLTTKHHEGFCLFDSEYTDYKATNTPAGRDLVREYVEAFREAGLKVGLYYSLLDWHHPDYPHYGHPYHPARNDASQGNEHRDFSRYVTYMHNQIKELMTNYGKIDLLWLDFSYDDMRGEKWRATELVNMIRSYQPDILIDNRLGYSEEEPDYDVAPCYCGDFCTPEQLIPPHGVKDCKGRNIPWEACLTSQSSSWGYRANNEVFMSAKDIVRILVDCVSNDGNLLLNVGPDAKGEFPIQIIRNLAEVGAWLRTNGESIYGCGSVNAPLHSFGRLTQNEKYIYVHLFDKIGNAAQLENVKPCKYGRFLHDGSEAELKFWNSSLIEDGNQVVVMPGVTLPDALDTVVRLYPKDN